MPGIVCAIRGGPASRPTIRKAIELAQADKLRVYFVYVVNLDFLYYTSSSRLSSISRDLREMGELILLTAREKAASAGVQAEGIIRQGKVADEIVALCGEIAADYIVLGNPKGAPDEDVFGAERLQQFITRVEEASHARVILTGK